ncbi:MAG: hypothetical protein CL457_06130 [Acidimicrobiaceae bacterium]|nr:hypothetical protein [Acidimicrobiaceae bacterium]|tara:strand:- start:1025 stop:1306 length:282 start_codon:yes stop_codon:yes gene_type:complete
MDSGKVKIGLWQYAKIVGITAVGQFNPEKWFNVADWGVMKKCHLDALMIVFSLRNDTFQMLAGTDSSLAHNRKNTTVINFGWEDAVLPIKVLL